MSYNTKYHTITTIKNTEKSQVYLATMEEREEPVIIKRMNTANPDVYKTLAEIHNEHIPQISVDHILIYLFLIIRVYHQCS